MVDPDSDRVSRAPPYSGTAKESSSFRVRGFHPLCQAFPKPFRYSEVFSNSAPCGQTALQPRHCWRFRLFQFRSPLLSESRLFSLPRVLRWFSSPSFASSTYVFSGRMTVSLPPGYPIRLSTDHRMCAPPRRFSQLTTAFFASIRQGIHRKPFYRLTILSFLLKFMPSPASPSSTFLPSGEMSQRPIVSCQRSCAPLAHSWR